MLLNKGELVNKEEREDLKKRIDKNTEYYIHNKAACGEDIQKGNLLRRLTLNAIDKMKDKE